MTTFYLAGSFYRMPELNVYRRRLESYGHNVTSRWLNGSHEIDIQERGDAALAPRSSAERFATEDLADIDAADYVLFFSSADHPSKGRGGRHTEFGYALATSKMIAIIGRRECVFHSLVEAYPTFDDWLRETQP